MPRFVYITKTETVNVETPSTAPTPAALTNGDFEAGLTGWTVDYGTATIINTGGQGDNGKFCRFTGATRISQTVAIPDATTGTPYLAVFIKSGSDVYITILCDEAPLVLLNNNPGGTWAEADYYFSSAMYGKTGTIYIQATGSDIDSVAFGESFD